MSNFIKIASVTGVALLAGAGIWAACRAKKQPAATAAAVNKTDVKPSKAPTASSRETLKEVSITHEPVVTDAVFGMYTRITKALADGSVTQVGATPTIVVQPLLDSEDGLNTLLYSPEKLIGERAVDEITVFVDDKGHAGDMILVIAYRDIVYSLLMRDESHFVAAGPLLDSISSMGYLQLLLETMVEQWKI